jgi:CBS domain-containing protein
MRWSWKIAEIGGIAVHVQATFAILLAWVAVSFWSDERAPIATAMRPDVLVVDASDMLDEAFQRLQGSPGAVAAVIDRGRFVGLLAADTLEDFVRLQAARRPRG